MGYIISIEGGEGSGKGTVVEKLKEKYPEFLFTREPGGTKISEQIRNIIVDKNNTEIAPETEALLFAAARAQLMSEKIIPAVNNGTTVLFDRFIDSSLVYQGIARNLGVQRIFEINQMAIFGMMPSLTIYLDIDPEVALKRIAENNRETNRIDLETLDFHRQIRKGYLDLSHLYPSRYRVINADQTPEKVFEDVVQCIKATIENK